MPTLHPQATSRSPLSAQPRLGPRVITHNTFFVASLRQLVFFFGCCGLFLCTGLANEAAFAQDNWQNQVRTFYVKGNEYFRNKRYDEAIVPFHRADRLLQQHCRAGRCKRAHRHILYFLGESYYRMRSYKAAYLFFRKYQKMGLLPKHTSLVQNRQRLLKPMVVRRRPKPRREKAPPPPARRTAPPPPPSSVGPVLTTVGGITIAAGLVAGAIALMENSAAQASPQSESERSGHEENFKTFGITSLVLLGTGLAVTITGIVLWMRRPSPQPVTHNHKQAPRSPLSAQPMLFSSVLFETDL